MLPFLKKLDEGSVSVPVKSVERKSDHGKEHAGLSVAMEELCAAEGAKDYKAMAAAFRAAFEMCESEPHHEGEHLED